MYAQNTTDNNCVIMHAQIRLHCRSLYVTLKYVGHWSQAKNVLHSPTQVIAKFICTLHSNYLYIVFDIPPLHVEKSNRYRKKAKKQNA